MGEWGSGERVAGSRGSVGGGGGAGRRWICYCLVSNVGTSVHMRASLIGHVAILCTFLQSEMKSVNQIFRFMFHCIVDVMVNCGPGCKS